MLLLLQACCAGSIFTKYQDIGIMRTLDSKEQKLWQSYMDQLTIMPAMVPYRPTRKVSYQLDLHSFTVHQAYLRCQDFIYQHLQQGTHYVTVITGRGGQIADEFPAWIKNLPGVKKITPLDGDMESAGSWILILRNNARST